MRPPLIEISINQPKVVTLNKDKKGKKLHVFDISLKHVNDINKDISD